jgi:predicted O-linked N-acetylglucosamine transferase (SPINDLY family)
VVNRLHAVTADSLGNKKIALKQLGRVLESAHFDPNAEEMLRLGLDIEPQQRDVLQHWLSLRQRQCEWPMVAPVGQLTRASALSGMSPLSMAAYTDDPMLQLANAARYNKCDISRPKLRLPNADRLLRDTRPGPLRIGYLSSDLREHAIGFLMSELLELHDPTRVEVFVYYCGHEVNDDIHHRFKAAAPNWRDIAAMTDEQAASTIAADEIAVLIDVNGYTHGARTSLLTTRPAPVIVNWLGFPATTGSPDHHYIIADDFIIPESHEIYYSEQVVRVPCYQANDRKRIVASHPPTRAEAGLPEDAMVYCCFNGAHKFTPFTWRRWMEILTNVPGSVLWLLDGAETTNERLRSLADQLGVGRERLVFAPRRANADHLARYPLADLFLDTSPYGAHTTASDALWMGVPVLTLAGRSFASRVCGSLVTSAGIGELACDDTESYVRLAVELGRSPTRLAAIRQRLRDGRDTCVLFDTPLLVSRLETAYHWMWNEARAGRRPRPDLANLDIYHDIGLSLDRDDREMLAAPDYEALYTQALIERDRISMIRGDSRLWPGAPVNPPRSRTTRASPEAVQQHIPALV